MDINELNIHNFMPSDSLFRVTASLMAEGKGFDIFSPTTKMGMEAGISCFEYASYSFSGINMKAGVENILALRGDMPKNGTICHDFLHASDLIEFIKRESSLSVAAAGYPEGHIEAESLEKDIEYLKLKTDKITLQYPQNTSNNSSINFSY